MFFGYFCVLDYKNNPLFNNFFKNKLGNMLICVILALDLSLNNTCLKYCNHTYHSTKLPENTNWWYFMI